MKFTVYLAGAVMAATSASALAFPMANAAAVAEPEARFHFRQFCHMPGQGCRKVKRAAEAAADALALAEPEADPRFHFRQFCHMPGQGCRKLRRSADALAEAVAEANANAHPEAEAEAFRFRQFCHMPGQGCRKVRRAAEEIHAALEGEDNDWADGLREAANDALASLPEEPEEDSS